MIETWHSEAVVRGWRVMRHPDKPGAFVARRYVEDFAAGIARLERREAKRRRKYK